MVLLGVVIAFALNRLRVKNYWPYLAAGVCSWFGLHEAHLHPALALVVIVPFMPNATAAAPRTESDAPPTASASTLLNFEHDWKIIVDFGLFLFGLCNAGVEFSAIGVITAIVFLSLLIGKTAGVVGFAALAKALGFPFPAGVGARELLIVGIISGIGLTVALFVAGEAFSERNAQDSAKMGALASALIAPLALVLARLLKVRPAQQLKTKELALP